ncbi:FtsK/SpoIIIE domain-containing protein [Microcoleus sp. herbarium14]|uniref:FtsK/SpoIIIE domain-containing protein n=1 Tax=Microcoleus sp. herbarium14 TaxID=3055439 RepID=UPI002FD36A62
MKKTSYFLSFEISYKRSIQETNKTELRKYLQQTQQQLISSISHLATNLIISLRYIYDPTQSPKLKTYLLINRPHNTRIAEDSEQILSLLTKGKLSQFFTLTPQPNLTPFQNLDWVQTIGEILKHEEFIPPQNYYLPHLFEANQTNDMSAVCDVIHRLDSKLILEITLQTYHNPTQKSLWVNAINQMLAQLDKVNANTSGIKDNILSVTSALYQKYQQSYPNSDLFQYSIKALAENRADAFPVLDTLIHEAIKETPHGKRCRIIQVSKNQPGFSESLEATKNVDISSAIEWEGWHKNNSEISIANAIQPQKKGLGKFGGDSGSLPDKPSFYPENQPPMIGGVNSEQNQNLPQLYNAVSDGSGLVKLSATPPASRMVDLKPLHRLATVQEISGFFRIAVPQEISIENMTEKSLPVANSEDLFNYYKSLLEQDSETYRDCYIVGINDEGNPVISSWAETPHRLVAGLTGAGKTNFLNWVIFQFLYANPTGKIYIADFAGVDFNFLAKHFLDNVEIITTVEECQKLVEKIHTDEYQRRIELLKQAEVHNIQELREEGVEIQRTLWIIDEAADIALAPSKLKETIQTRLIEYARKGRKCGLHVIYCTQRPSTAIITPQVLESCEEKVVFRVSLAASEAIIESSQAAKISKESRGRAVLMLVGGDENNYVNTPYIRVPVGKKVLVEDTLWRYLATKS